MRESVSFAWSTVASPGSATRAVHERSESWDRGSDKHHISFKAEDGMLAAHKFCLLRTLRKRNDGKLTYVHQIARTHISSVLRVV